jgi:predicted glycoside hydrolase/deacetylase ChbG (UPF0249 family)
VVIFHADDIGMCQAGLDAYQELIEFGLLSSAATMVPCPWFPATATLCQTLAATHPHVDMGAHLTLTSEWDNFRWGPVSTREGASGLLDEAGYFHSRVGPMQAHGRAAAVQVEIEAQLKQALAAGVDVTHMDSHMGSIFHPDYMPHYIELAQKYQIPALAFRWQAHNILAGALEGETAVKTSKWLQALEANGFPLLDSIFASPLDSHENQLGFAQKWLAQLTSGIHYFIIHPSKETPELRTIAPDWRSRVADYELFTNETWRQTVAASGVQVIGWRAIRESMRAGD